MADAIPQLDDEALALFARKGLEAGADAPQVGEANAVKVRRVMQLTADLRTQPFERMRILDLGCGEGVYAIEAGLRGAEVLALDARRERMDEGAAVATRHGLDNVSFREEDVRGVSRDRHGEFDVVYCLGLLYHLDAAEAFDLLESVCALCERLLIVDTLISTEPELEVRHRDAVYQGQRVREHDDADPPEVRKARLLRSIDSTFAFRFARESLVRALSDVGFDSVLECHAPPEPGKAEDRVSIAALKGESVALATYPWVNDSSEAEIERRLRSR
jgi:SAM-dependent methyltransferase